MLPFLKTWYQKETNKISLMNYIKSFFKSLAAAKVGARDFLFSFTIVLLLFTGDWCNKSNSSSTIKTPSLAPVEQTTAKDGTKQTVVPVTVLTKEDMKQVTKPIKKNLGLDKVSSVDSVVISVDVKTDSIPVTITDSTVETVYKTDDITIKHLYDVVNKTGQFDVHLTPDTVTFVHGVVTHWLKPDEHTLRIQHTNSLFKDKLASSYTYKEPKPWVVVGPSTGIAFSYDGVKIRAYPMIGVTATVPLIMFKHKK